MRVIASLLFLLAACATAPAPPGDLNALAERFVRLSLEIGTHEEGYIDAYYGPAEWRTEAEASPRSVARLKTDADALRAELAAAAARAPDAATARRARTLEVYASSARFRLDMIEGRRVPLADEAEALFNLRPDLRPLSSYDAALARVEAVVPGEGPLAQRVDAFLSHYSIPQDRLTPVMQAAIAECRRRTLAHFELPENERFEMELVSGVSWGAYNWYRGNNHSLIQINAGLPVRIDSAIGYGCHEGYPGHHVQGISAERLYRERGFVEYSVLPLFSPMGPLNEGAGNYGVELAFPGDEQAEFERRVLYPLAGLDPATAHALDAFDDAMDELDGVRLTIAAMYLGGEIDRERAIELTQRYQLMSRERAERTVAFAEQYRSYVINYSTGEDVVRAYIERAGPSPEARWRAYEDILNQPTLPEHLR
ncbi:MAG TPA: hypothetical protein VEF55_00780 [Candidatus Binatia bacterium]|nr:hypothetical protein [Candidatus Binatia bacterium]